MRLWLAFTLLGFAPFLSANEAITAGGLAGACETTILKEDTSENADSALLRGFCVGYLRSYLETYFILNETGGVEEAMGCIPPSTSPIQAAQVLVDFVESNPEAKELMPAVILYVSLGSNFPCDEN